MRGIYDNWEASRTQLHGASNQYRSFETHDEAAFYVAIGQAHIGVNGEALFAEWKRTRQSRIPEGGTKVEKKPQIKAEISNTSQSSFSRIPDFWPDGSVANIKSVLINIIDYIDAKRNGRLIKI
ncbi:hypothetical protein EKO27_g6044 [Xylaria grammica]|uniref:Ribonuclease H1 N-terminal domain-containing protein n=1 Tax=Xylaria grammica TaxID=363999 RepID=A0A439D3T2_9PEZI|nr:hypothetical protein EKO27_g6044 [Xylaria grammica]